MRSRNLPLTPQAVTYGSHTPVWWRCENGHEWEAVVYTRTHGSGCPFCAGKKAQAGFNDLATQYPELARQWDYTKNIPVLPADVTTGSHRLVWWKCEKGHSWRAKHPFPHLRVPLSGLRRAADSRWRERPCDGGSGAGTGMGHGAQRQADPAGRSAGDREKGLVGFAGMDTTGGRRSLHGRTGKVAAHIVPENWC